VAGGSSSSSSAGVSASCLGAFLLVFVPRGISHSHLSFGVEEARDMTACPAAWLVLGASPALPALLSCLLPARPHKSHLLGGMSTACGVGQLAPP
jgi:hypothetical protein